MYQNCVGMIYPELAECLKKHEYKATRHFKKEQLRINLTEKLVDKLDEALILGTPIFENNKEFEKFVTDVQKVLKANQDCLKFQQKQAAMVSNKIHQVAYKIICTKPQASN